MPLHDRVVDLLDLAVVERALELGVRALGLRDDHEPARAGVEPVHDALRARARPRSRSGIRRRRGRPTTVGPSQPSEGCAATPTGLSMTTRSSSSWTMPRSGTAIGSTSSVRGGSQLTSSQPPARSRSDLSTDAPSSRHAAGRGDLGREGAREAEQLREARVDAHAVEPVGNGEGPVLHAGLGASGEFASGARPSPRVASPAAVRPPAASACRFAGLRSTRAVEADAADRQDHEQHHARHDRDVGDVVDRREASRRRDEVDHVAEAEARLPEEPVGEVAEHAAEQEPEDERPGDRADAPGEPDDEGDHAGGEDREDPGHAAREREGRAGVRARTATAAPCRAPARSHPR